ncbi:hypothetical protein GCM10018790_38910 [Kitasatospora xanthocidica]|uniref:hypothetical protein n=1 Tax=Kitasatospora xanthocidica TaxID=83382 RepID=UPI001671A5A9|nr:hypothetical protein [Kitasatospora xanthocidica]GHF57107.1 hypothetical protein GCM10018790_38910 [Kitasatospora xanthocidica]
MNGYDVYCKAMTGDQWRGWWVTWPPSSRVRLGDVLDRQDSVRRAGSLADRGVSFISEDGTPPGLFVYDSNKSVSVRFKAAGAAPDPLSGLSAIDAGASVTFGKENTAFVVFRGIAQTGIADVRSLANDLATLWWNKAWDESLLAVTSVVSARGGTVLAAAAAGATAELKVAASAGVAGVLQLADLALDASVVHRSALGAEWTGADVTPFYQVVRLRENWRGKVHAEYGPRQSGHGALPTALPPLLTEEIRDDPAAVLGPVDEAEQLPFAPSRGG